MKKKLYISKHFQTYLLVHLLYQYFFNATPKVIN